VPMQFRRSFKIAPGMRTSVGKRSGLSGLQTAALVTALATAVVGWASVRE
jgi:hypothetical protein